MKIMIMGRRRFGLTRAGMSHHLRRVHGPMLVTPPVDAGALPSGYVQNHVRDGAAPAAGPDAGCELDFVTEVWFDNPQVARASLTTPYYRSVLEPDEPRFVALDTVRRCVADEEIVIDDGLPGHHKAFLFWRHSGSEDGFAANWAGAREAAAKDGILRWVANTTAAMPGSGATRPFDGIDELWITPGYDVDLLFNGMVAALGRHADAPRCCFVLAEEFTTARLRAG